MRVFLAHLPVWATMVMTMLGLVRAVATKDAFKTDWVHYNSGPLIKHALLDHQTVAELSQKNVLYMRDIASSKVTSYIDLSLHDSDDFVLGEDSLVTFSKNSTVVSVFEKYSGVFIASITLNAPPVDIQGYRGSGWTILQEAGGENGENGGELVTWYNHKLYSLGTQYGRALSHYTLPQTTYVFTGTDVFSLTENHNEGVSTLRVENVDHGFFYDIAFPPGVVDEVALTNENKSPIYVTNDTAVSYHASDFVIYSTSGSEPTALYRKTFDDIVDMQVSGSTVLLVTQHKAYILDLSKFLQKLTPTSVSIKIVELHPDLHSAVLSGGHFVALNGNGTSLLVHDYDIASGDSSVVPLSVPSFESTGGAIIVNVPPSLAKIEEAHHLVEEARSSSIIHRWLLRTRTHLSQLGQLMAQVVLRKSTSAFSGEEDVFGFNKILVQIDQSHSVVAAKSSKNGDLIWVYDFSADGNIREVKASGSEVYVFFDSSVHILDLRWGKLVSSRAFESPIEKVVSLKTTPSEEEDDLEEPVAPEAIAVKIGETLEFLTGEQNVTSSQFILHQDSNVLHAYKVDNNKLRPTWQWNKPTEKLVAVSKNSDTMTTAGGIARYDRSVLYKYLNPNLVSIISKGKDTLTLSLVDGITGAVIHTQQHSGETIDIDSICIIQNDNWVVYSMYVTSPVSEQRIVVIDLFQESKDVSGAPKTSFKTANVTASTNSFIYPEKILSLASTDTKFGITVKSIIALTESGSLVEIPKYLLNSRRVDGRKMTTNDQMDDFGMLPYEPVIHHNTFKILNHKNKLHISKNNNKILLSPTDLESTSVVCFVNEFNEFCTVVQPSSSYDLLKSEFDKPKLILTIVALLAAYIITKPFVDSKKLNSKWVD